MVIVTILRGGNYSLIKKVVLIIITKTVTVTFSGEQELGG